MLGLVQIRHAGIHPALDQMPLTASGKIIKRDLVDWIEEGRATPKPVRWSWGMRET